MIVKNAVVVVSSTVILLLQICSEPNKVWFLRAKMQIWLLERKIQIWKKKLSNDFLTNVMCSGCVDEVLADACSLLLQRRASHSAGWHQPLIQACKWASEVLPPLSAAAGDLCSSLTHFAPVSVLRLWDKVKVDNVRRSLTRQEGGSELMNLRADGMSLCRLKHAQRRWAGLVLLGLAVGFGSTDFFLTILSAT